MSKFKLNKLHGKKAITIGTTATWIVATFIILFILFIYFLGVGFLAKNWFFKPEITLKELIDDFDKSQMLLLVLTALTPLLIYLILRVAWDLIMYGNVAALFGTGLYFVLFLETLIFIYLGYFVVKVLRK